MPLATTDFGFYPLRLSLRAGDITIATRPDFGERTKEYEKWEGVEGDWIYPPLREMRDIGGDRRTLPYVSRVFGLPKTHALTHANASGPEHMEFHVWALSFFLGMRLTTTEAGFVDATPIRPQKLVDFHLSHAGLPKAVALAASFWLAHRNEPARAKRFVAAVHALFLSHYPQSLEFEQFIYLYNAVDACYALAASIQPPQQKLTHSDRIDWMCNLFGMTTPAWARRPSGSIAPIAEIRNMTLHEALFMNKPLGFAVHSTTSNQNLPLEMQALVCRFLVALMGARGASYVTSPVNTRQIHGLELA
jgi:hypothetical protein